MKFATKQVLFKGARSIEIELSDSNSFETDKGHTIVFSTDKEGTHVVQPNDQRKINVA
jgi:hypothetical protein